MTAFIASTDNGLMPRPVAKVIGAGHDGPVACGCTALRVDMGKIFQALTGGSRAS